MLSSLFIIARRSRGNRLGLANRGRRLTTATQKEHLVVRPSVTPGGICGLEVRRARDIEAMAQAALVECQHLVNRLKVYETLSPSEVVNTLDEISDLVCKVCDPSALLQSVFSDELLVNAADNAVRKIQQVIVALNQDPTLEQATRWACNRRNELTPEEQSVADQLLIEFEHQGASLLPEQKREHSQLQSEMHDAGEHFREAVTSATEGRKVEIPPEVLPPHITRTLKRTPNKTILVNTADRNLVNLILSTVGDEGVRKQFYYNNKTALVATERLLQARQSVAAHLGFPSYSHYYAWHRSLKTPAEVIDFLKNLNSELQPKIQSELAVLGREKMRHVGSNQINEWDFRYYSQKLQETSKRLRTPKSGHSGSTGLPSPTLEEYFTLENIFRAIQTMWRSLFNVRLEIVTGIESEIWHPLVFKIEFYDEGNNNEYLGNAYFDLMAREGKPTPANYPIRLRSRRATASSALLTSISAQSELPGAMTHRDIALARGSEALFSIKPTLVPYDDVRTLFHELGHMTQSILCRNQLQHFSGTRGFMDHVETPSQVLELFASDYRFVKLFARHYQTGEVLSEGAFNSHIVTNGMFAGLKTNHQVIMAALDQKLHAGPFKNSEDICREVITEFAAVPHHPDDMPHAGFSHLLGYGSVYYSYLFCGVKASQIYANVFGEDPLSPKAGKFYRDEFLALGGAADPNQLLKTLTGKSPDPSYFVQDICSGRL